MAEIIGIPELSLPNTKDMTAWAVNACDQFTANKAYWERVRSEVGEHISTLDLIYPEAFLTDTEMEKKFVDIHAKMKEYRAKGHFRKLAPGFILVERKTTYSDKIRYGLVLTIDLESYSYEAGAKSFVRSGEAVLQNRLKARLKFKRGSVVETSHTVMLYGDPKNEVLGDVIKKRNDFPVLYDFPLNMNGGSVRGYYIPLKKATEIRERFYQLIGGREVAIGRKKTDAILFVVGDGNHALTAAKQYWEEKKETLTDDERATSPYRYAMVEVENLFSDAVEFAPIHRLVRVKDRKRFLANLDVYTSSHAEENYVVSFRGYYDVPDMIRKVDSYIKAYLSSDGGSVDYIYNEEELKRYVEEHDDAVGILLNPIEKITMIEHVKREGAYPQKTFSLGRDIGKRYYCECREL